MKKNTLKGAQAFQVAKWLEDNIAALGDSTRAAAAAKATEALGFSITEANIAAAELAIGKSLRGRGRPARGTSDAARLLARELVAMQAQLGISTSQALHALAHR